jgi:VIT1/CCC1 family predicted Fe2+/Mn2+ transporter
MKSATRVGLGFGITSGVITTLGLIVGVNAASSSKGAILGAIATIAIADAFSDALGIHISQESVTANTVGGIWKSTITTFLAKFFIALSFAVPLLLFKINTAIILDIIWGMILLTIVSYYLAKTREEKPFNVISEHLLIATAVIVLTRLVGHYVGNFFNK